ncbi:hypothetical protein [Halomonas elongata]|uniref:hypothetical protein n=1 Tax=Halomonas elongata TaxID=2746 RepID=UPI0040334135
MTFHTHIAGIPCLCEVTHYCASLPMLITGTGFGDAEPPEPEEFEYRILDRRGRLAEWLERKVTQEDETRLLAEYRAEESEAA